MAFGTALRSVLANQPKEYDRINILRATIPVSRSIATSVMQELANCKQDDEVSDMLLD
jgi:hypothetical protein